MAYARLIELLGEDGFQEEYVSLSLTMRETSTLIAVLSRCGGSGLAGDDVIFIEEALRHLDVTPRPGALSGMFINGREV